LSNGRSRLDDLYTADEVFITSTNRNVIGIRENRRPENLKWNHWSRLPSGFDVRLSTRFVMDYVEAKTGR